MAIKKLIEVALPLEKINEESAREKSIRHGHPSTLHLWWARRPLAAARAVIWASLVDDPSSHPELFPTEEEQNLERQRLFKILEELVKWENSTDQAIINLAKKEINKYTNGNAPALLDPFAGGGTIPFEAQRLGLKAYAQDLNPVAVMINKAMIEFPAKFNGVAPINPETYEQEGFVPREWKGAEGLAEDIRYYGKWMEKEAQKQIGMYYPSIKVPKEQGGGDATIIAWIWARTVKCPNPACGCDMPLIRSFDIGKKKGRERHIEPVVNGKNIKYVIRDGKSSRPGTINRSGAKCVVCDASVKFPYIRQEGKEKRFGYKLVAIVALGQRGRLYLDPTDEQVQVALSANCSDYLDGELGYYPGYINPVGYGITEFTDLYTKRQLAAVSTFCNLIPKVKEEIQKDLVKSRKDLGDDYCKAISLYLAFAVDRLASRMTNICVWHSIGEKVEHLFGMQGMPMTWDFAEANPFSGSTGSWSGSLEWIPKFLERAPAGSVGIVKQMDAQTDSGLRNVLISTDPPYYNNIIYADFSDFFYVWMRKMLKDDYPDIFATMLTPKKEELIANPYRFDGNIDDAKDFFEEGMSLALKQVYVESGDYPVSIYYAYKQKETVDDEGESSRGWETMLSAIINAGFTITATWPVRTELTTGLKTFENTLASSIVLVCRKRSNTALTITRRNFINELKRSLKPSLQKLQVSNIAPVDLAQSAIGPGMEIYSKYSQVLEADGSPMSVRSALKIINQELDLYFNEQDSELDSESRFCVDLYSQFAFNEMPFGSANTLATAKNTSVSIMASHGTLYAQKGKVHLIERPDLPENINEYENSIWLLCQQLTYRMEKEGVEGCAKAIFNMFGSNAERAKDLAYRLYTIAEKKKWAQEAFAYNALVVAWPEIQSRAAELKAVQPEQMSLLDFLQ
ncbi:MAG: DUF1156 domain-containing protein [Oscillospiraceae bacterium]|nr:DUF1156 domain-containing protein [Oscillospiraceae bacterium]